MKTLIITIQDTDNGEFISSRLVEKYEHHLDENYLISLIRKAEKDLEKLIWQRELQNGDCDERVKSAKILKNEKK